MAEDSNSKKRLRDDPVTIIDKLMCKNFVRLPNQNLTNTPFSPCFDVKCYPCNLQLQIESIKVAFGIKGNESYEELYEERFQSNDDMTFHFQQLVEKLESHRDKNWNLMPDTNGPSISTTPFEVFKHIMDFLSIKERVNLGSVSRRMQMFSWKIWTNKSDKDKNRHLIPYTNGPTMSTMPFEILQYIMELLTVKERANLERVSRRMRGISLTTWRNKKDVPWSYLRNYVDYLLPRCAPYMLHLRFDMPFNSIWKLGQKRELVDVFSEYDFPKLQHLDVSGHRILSAADVVELRMAFFPSKVTAIESIDFGTSLSIVPFDRIEQTQISVEIGLCLQRCPNLKKLSIGKCFLGLDFLSEISDTIQCIELDRIETGKNVIYKTLFKKPRHNLTRLVIRYPGQKCLYSLYNLVVVAPNLHQLDLTGCPFFDDFACLKYLQIQKLYLGNCFETERPDYQNLFRELTDTNYQLCNTLRVLHINKNSLAESTLMDIGGFHLLEELSIVGVCRTTERVFHALRHCHQLNKLIVSWSTHFNDDCLGILGGFALKLQYLDITGCWGPTNEGMMSMLNKLSGKIQLPVGKKLVIERTHTRITEEVGLHYDFAAVSVTMPSLDKFR